MTGLTRGEVENHLSSRQAATKRRALSALRVFGHPLSVLTVWNSDSRFSTPYGVALDLALTRTGHGRSFEDLVEVATPGADPDVVLDRLVAAGCAEIEEPGFVRCTNHSYVPADISTDRIAHVGIVLSDLAATLTSNLLTDAASDRHFERAFRTEFRISDDGYHALRDRVSREGTQLLESLDTWFSADGASSNRRKGGESEWKSLCTK